MELHFQRRQKQPEDSGTTAEKGRCGQEPPTQESTAVNADFRNEGVQAQLSQERPSRQAWTKAALK